MNVLFPLWNLDPVNWARIQNTLKPIAKRVDLQIVYPDNFPAVTDRWAKFIRIPSFLNYRLTDMLSLTSYVIKILMKADDFDLVYCFSSGPFFQLVAVLIAEMAKKPCVMHINGNGALSRGFFMDKSKKMSEDVIDLLSLNSVDKLVPISSNLRDVMREKLLNPERVLEPVPFCVSEVNFPQAPMPETLSIGYAGRISPEKGSDFLLDVMRETPEIRYKLAGPIEKMNGVFPDNASYKGVYDHLEMKYFYYLCSILALPSHGEGISAQILESYKTGRGIIATPEAHPDELPIIGLELPRDKALWIKELRALDNTQTHKIGLEARRWVDENWPSWDDFGDRMKDIFLSVSPP